MEKFTLYILIGLFFISCGPDKPKSGKSELVINNTGETDENSDLPDEESEVVDSSYADAHYAISRQKMEKEAEKALQAREEKPVRISGTIIGGAGMSITLDKLGGKTNMEPLKTTIINEDGYFELDATTNQEQIFNLRTDVGNMLLFLDAGNYEVKADITKLSQYQVNAPMSYKVRDFYMILEEFNGRNDKLQKREQKYSKAKKAWKVQRLLDSLPIINAKIEEERAKAIINFIENNRNSPFAAEAANRLDFLKHTAYIEKLYDELVLKFPYSSYVKNVGLKLIRFRPMALGKDAPELVMPDINGTNYRLSSNKGKYSLVMFTVSYSERCQLAAKNLIPIYNKYKSKGFEIYNVCIDEMQEDMQSWLDATKAPWIVVSDFLGPNSTAFDYYIAHDYPMTYMISPEGKLIAKFLEPADVEKMLAEKLK